MVRNIKKHQYIVITFFIVMVITFLGLRLVYLPQSLSIGSDAGRDFLQTWNIYSQRKLVLIGPPSQFSVFNHHFFFGPAPYYTILPAMIIGHGNIVFISLYLIIINALALAITLFILYWYLPIKRLVFIFAYFLTLTPALVSYSQSYWNPYLMLPVSTLLIGVLGLIIHDKRKRWIQISCLVAGILCGLGLQMHYSFILAIGATVVALFFHRKFTIFTALLLIIGFVIGFSPVILFELRNHFYNLTTFLLMLQQRGGPQLGGAGFYINSILPVWTFLGAPAYYAISVIPFWFLLFSFLLGKATKVRYGLFIVMAVLAIYGFFALRMLLVMPNRDWNYPTLAKIAAIIKSQKPVTFNVVDQITIDNDASMLRYVLTTQSYPPMATNMYPYAHTIFVYTRLSQNQIENSGLFEITAAGPHQIIKKWYIKNGIYLYELEYKNF